MKKTPKVAQKNSHLKQSIAQWVKSVLLIDAVFWIFVGVGCAKDSISCMEGVTFLPYFFYAPFSFIPQPWLVGLQSTFASMLGGILFLLFCHILFGIVLGYLFQKNRVKWAMSISLSFVLIIGLAFICGFLGYQKEMTASTVTKTIAVTKVEDGFLSYVDFQWYEGEDAIEAAKNDGCGEGCSANGFYMKVDTGNVTSENVQNFENATVTLLQQPGITPVELSFNKYLEARYECKMTPESCMYYGIGADYEYFDATLNDGGFISLVERYLP